MGARVGGQGHEVFSLVGNQILLCLIQKRKPKHTCREHGIASCAADSGPFCEIRGSQSAYAAEANGVGDTQAEIKDNRKEKQFASLLAVPLRVSKENNTRDGD